jgi:CHAT domain-containing protein
VVVLADGELNNLNFETLLVPDPSIHYWVEDVTVANASSLRMLAARNEAPKSTRDKLFLIGDAISAAPEYGSLPNAKLEMADVQKHFPENQRQVYAGGQATARAYLSSQPEQYDYIHFVAHGTASLLSPLDSAVVLSPATGRPDSFKLYARDILHQRLSADLVTISACYGAGSRAYTGEGLVGLSWAFLRAGAHNVIGALWEVSDSSTPQLMDQMYTELGKGRAPDEALRAAKLTLLHSDGVYRKPFYWAPFQLYTGS